MRDEQRRAAINLHASVDAEMSALAERRTPETYAEELLTLAVQAVQANTLAVLAGPEPAVSGYTIERDPEAARYDGPFVAEMVLRHVDTNRLITLASPRRNGGRSDSEGWDYLGADGRVAWVSEETLRSKWRPVTAWSAGDEFQRRDSDNPRDLIRLVRYAGGEWGYLSVLGPAGWIDERDLLRLYRPVDRGTFVKAGGQP